MPDRSGMTFTLQDGQNVGLFDDKILLRVDGHFRARVFAVEDGVADSDFHRLVSAAGADGHDSTLLRFFLCIVRDIKAPGGHRFGFLGLDNDSGT